MDQYVEIHQVTFDEKPSFGSLREEPFTTKEIDEHEDSNKIWATIQAARWTLDNYWTNVFVESEEEENYDDGYDKGIEDGKEEGYEDGLADGKIEGYTDGYVEGHTDGYEKGFGEGYKEGYEKGKGIEKED